MLDPVGKCARRGLAARKTGEQNEMRRGEEAREGEATTLPGNIYLFFYETITSWRRTI